jgi:hypothetical protein
MVVLTLVLPPLLAARPRYRCHPARCLYAPALLRSKQEDHQVDRVLDQYCHLLPPALFASHPLLSSERQPQVSRRDYGHRRQPPQYYSREAEAARAGNQHEALRKRRHDLSGENRLRLAYAARQDPQDSGSQRDLCRLPAVGVAAQHGSRPGQRWGQRRADCEGDHELGTRLHYGEDIPGVTMSRC